MIEIRNIHDFNDFVEQLLSQNESDDLEYKSAAGGFPGSFWDTYSAFANSEGGVIILGVAEKKNGLYLDKLSDELIEKYRKDFWNNVNNTSTISCNLMKTDDVKVVNYKGHNLMLFCIPRARREQRPVYRTTQPYNGTFKRNHEGDYKCTEREVQRMFSDANVSCSADSRILCGYDMNDIDKASINQYRQLFSIAKPDHPWLALDDKDLLQKLGGYRKDRQSGKEGFTLAGLLMFGKGSSITDNECCPDFFPDFQEKFDTQLRWTNRIIPDGTWEANLFQFYRQVLPRLQAILPKPFILEDNIRREETPAHIAVREALINLCVHADYSENASLSVKLYKDKIVFSNPGTLLVSLEQYYQGGESVCRNKSLQTMFMMLGSAEKAGSGVDKIFEGWKASNWRKPIFETKVRPDKCELTMKLESIMDEHVENELKEKFGEDILHVDHTQLLILNLVCIDGYVTNESLRYSLSIHKADITDILKQMCKQGWLESKGYGRGTIYRFANVATSDINVATSEANVATSEANVATSNAKQRMKYDELCDKITSMAQEWISLNEIAKGLDRKPTYLRNHILSKMITDQKLEMMFPATPNHPQQKYRAKETTDI